MKRVAIINKDKCKPTKCNFECGLACPINRQGRECVSIRGGGKGRGGGGGEGTAAKGPAAIGDLEDTVPTKKRTAYIAESACIGCGMCAKAPEHGGCPFGAISIVNIPTELEGYTIHRYMPNGFRLYRMPIMRPGKILGLIGQNGIGKSTIVQILAGKLNPNFGIEAEIEMQPDPLAYFKGTEMHTYMNRLRAGSLRVSIKPQHVESLIPYLTRDPVLAEYTVADYLASRGPPNDHITQVLELDRIMSHRVAVLSGGELQRLLCAVCLMSQSDVYIFDEPTNYLDVRQRLNVARLIHECCTPDRYIVVIEHDLSILDYISDNVSILYGHPGAYGVCSQPMVTAVGINTYFNGYIPGENMRFRSTEISLAIQSEVEEGIVVRPAMLSYPGGEIVHGPPAYSLQIEPGTFPTEGSVCVIMGQNGTGKTTFIRHLAESLGACSWKPQYLTADEFGKATVKEVLYNRVGIDEMFRSDVIKPLALEGLYGRQIGELSGGEMQRFRIALCLGTKAYIYLLDEPSACLDIEQRLAVTKVIKRFIMHNRKVAFVIEHDMMMAVSMGCEQGALAVNVYRDGEGIHHASAPKPFIEGINTFLQSMDITFRTQGFGSHSRPRINKLGSVCDVAQKRDGRYYG